MDSELQRYVKILVKLGIGVLGLVAIYLLYAYVGRILIKLLAVIPGLIAPFILAILLALLIEPLIKLFEKRLKLKRGLATFVSMLLSLGCLVLILTALINRLITELVGMYTLISDRSSQIIQMVMNGSGQVKIFYLGLHLPPAVQEGLKGNLGNVFGVLKSGTMGAVNWLGSFIAGLPEFFVLLLIATVATYFLASDRERILNWLGRPFSDDVISSFRDIFTRLTDAFFGFLRAIGIMVSITIVQTIIGLLILQVPYAFTLGLIIGLCDVVPLVGPGVIYIPWIIWQFATGHSGLALGLMVVWVTGIIIRQLLEPKVVGKQVGLHPLVTLMALYIGMKIAGAVGMILGPVLVILILACNEAGAFDFIKKRRTT